MRALMLQAFYSIRSERQLVDRIDHDLLFRWFVELGIEAYLACGLIPRRGGPAAHCGLRFFGYSKQVAPSKVRFAAELFAGGRWIRNFGS